MIHYDATTTIQRPAREVFDWLVDPVRMDQWTSMTDGRWLSGAPGGQGATAEASLHMGPINSTMRWQLTEYVPGERIAFATLPGGPVQWTGFYELTPDGDRTLVRSVGDMRPNGVMRVLEPLMRAEVERGEAGEIEKLKAILEGSTGAATDAR
ncbi:MAG TPA: SRPBCC family protein [Candidatus Limnocylindria bacterium]|nr:SRPBCC family protein [Candidatus Limnocylindria bacterium]